MTRPTPEQVAEARRHLAPELSSDRVSVVDTKSLRILLAATEPPTDEELAEESACVLYGDPPPAEQVEHNKVLLRDGGQLYAVRFYAAGARREGRR